MATDTDKQKNSSRPKLNMGMVLVSFVFLFVLCSIAERAAVPNYTLPFGWGKPLGYDYCTQEEIAQAQPPPGKHCPELCPQMFPPGTRGNGFPLTVDYSPCDPGGERVNILAAPLNVIIMLGVSAGFIWLINIVKWRRS